MRLEREELADKSQRHWRFHGNSQYFAGKDIFHNFMHRAVATGVERDFVSAVVRACNESQAQISVGELSAVLSPSPLPDEAQRLKVDQFAVNGNTDSVGFLVRVWRLVNRFRRKK